MKKATSSDVAKLAGVSQAAVSLILNGNEKISFSNETRERVFKAAQQLGYTLPSRKKKKSSERVLLIFTPRLTNTYYTDLIQYVEEYVRPMGYYVHVCNTFRKPELEQYYLENLVTSHVVGIIYTFLPSFPTLLEQIMQTVPAVIIGEKQEGLAMCSVGLNNVNAGAMMAAHLYELGHRKIAFLSTPLNRLTMARAQRLEGVRQQMVNYGLQDNLEILISDQPELEFDSPDDTPYEYVLGRRLAADFLKDNRGATALIGVNDMIALGIIAELTAAGYRIPQDYSVCGFDNIFAARLSMPGLTTIDHRLRARCHAAADMLLNGMSAARKNPGFSDMHLVDRIEYTPYLSVRQSTGPCKTSE